MQQIFTRCFSPIVGLICTLFLFGIGSVNTSAQQPPKEKPGAESIRIATFNVSLYGETRGEIRRRLMQPDDQQAKRLASVVQTVRPDILLINELDYESDSAPAKLLAENYFAVAQSAVAQSNANATSKLAPVHYPYLYSVPSNTGVDSALDLNHDSTLGSGNDAWGFGNYPGQYAMAVFSRYPIDSDSIRTFQSFRWKDLPDAIRPVHPKTGQPYYDDATWQQIRLSSKNHVDVPIEVADRILHVLASHPTPPVFDGPEDRNGARNHDEIQFWNHYLSNTARSAPWLIDDRGRSGGLTSHADFVVLGDLNADPVEGAGRRESIIRLINHPRVHDVQPRSSQSDAAQRQHKYRGASDVRTKTADFGRNGLMRVDFVLPSRTLNVIDSGIFWPASSDPSSDWIRATDHRMVWIDVAK